MIARRRATGVAAASLISAAVIGLGIAGALNLIASAPDLEQSGQLVSAGLLAQSQGNLDDAEQLYRQALGHDPHSAFAYYDLGTIEQQRGQVTTAIDAYEAALDSDPTLVPALYNLAVLETVSTPADAIKRYQDVIRLDPGNALAHLNLGFLYVTLGEASAAQSEFTAAVRLDPTVRPRIPAGFLPG